MIKGVCALILLIAVVAPVAADVELPPWSWSTYSGTQAWTVTITDSGCDYNNNYQTTVSIKFANGTAVMDDDGHGKAAGTFASPNILHIQGRTVDDPPGSSQISAYDLFFTTDCSAFAGKYSWSYSGPDDSCSGTTTLSGVNRNGCPAPAGAPSVPAVAPALNNQFSAETAAADRDLSTLNDLQYTQNSNDINPQFARLANLLGQGDGLSSDELKSRIAELSQKTENELQAILVKDPYNFDANYDMAQLKKSQHRDDAYLQYLNAAMTSKVTEKKVEDLPKNIAVQNGFTTMPTRSSSVAVSQEDSDIQLVIKDVLGRDYSKVYSDSKQALARLYARYCERKCNYLSESVNEAASTGDGGSP